MTEFFMSLHQYGDWGLLALRIALGCIFFVHGKAKWSMWKMSPSEQMSAGMISMMRFLSIVEPLGAIAALSGFFAQAAAMGFICVMMGAIALKRQKMHVPFMAQNGTGWEFDFMILAGATALLFLGSGSISLERMFFGV